jgi:hypothetical protein
MSATIQNRRKVSEVYYCPEKSDYYLTVGLGVRF